MLSSDSISHKSYVKDINDNIVKMLQLLFVLQIKQQGVKSRQIPLPYGRRFPTSSLFKSCSLSTKAMENLGFSIKNHRKALKAQMRLSTSISWRAYYIFSIRWQIKNAASGLHWWVHLRSDKRWVRKFLLQNLGDHIRVGSPFTIVQLIHWDLTLGADCQEPKTKSRMNNPIYFKNTS